jgi:hypothetical protein
MSETNNDQTNAKPKVQALSQAAKLQAYALPSGGNGGASSIPIVDDGDDGDDGENHVSQTAYGQTLQIIVLIHL